MNAPEYRRDPVTGRWVILAPQRAERPIDPFGDAVHCPFCPGHERQTPPELFAIRPAGSNPDDPDWTVRVIPNRYPAVQNDVTPDGDFEDRWPGYGRHELVIECREHHLPPGDDFPNTDVLTVWQQRLTILAADPRLVAATIFKNCGAEAGASLEHPHSQIIATPFVPPVLNEEWVGSRESYEVHRRCLFCVLLDQSPTILENSSFRAIPAPAPRFAYETWILPRHHESRFESCTDLVALASLLLTLGQALSQTIPDLGFNLILHSAPLRTPETSYFHWHLELLPRTSKAAGFEWGAGIPITVVTPEAAAATLSAKIKAMSS